VAADDRPFELIDVQAGLADRDDPAKSPAG
jgi:hypothetical protein